MTNKKVRTLLYVFLCCTLSSVIGQARDTSYFYNFAVEENGTLSLDINHSQIQIIESLNDSISISIDISLIPNNYKHPFADVMVDVDQQGESKIHANLAFTDNSQPSNQLKSKCIISIPQNTQLNLKNRYSTIFLQTQTGEIQADFSYVTLNAGILSPLTAHNISAKYSTINFSSLRNTLNLSGNNITLSANRIDKLYCNTEFSNLTMDTTGIIVGDSYTDKFIVAQVDSITLNGEYTSCSVDYLDKFIQTEMSYGLLKVNKIARNFDAINVANSYVNTNININGKSNFALNADMRYCNLIHPDINLSLAASPKGKLYNGHYGTNKNNAGSVSIISSFGDVEISICN